MRPKRSEKGMHLSDDHPFLSDTDGRMGGYKELLRQQQEVPDFVLDTIAEWLVDRLAVDRATW